MSNIPIGSDVSWAPWNEPAREEPCCPRCKSESVFMAGRIVRRMNAQGVYEIVKKEITGICRHCWHKADSDEFNF